MDKSYLMVSSTKSLNKIPSETQEEQVQRQQKKKNTKEQLANPKQLLLHLDLLILIMETS